MTIITNSINYSPVQYNILTGGANGSINNISPGTVVNYSLTSNGASAQPTFQAQVMSSSITLTNAQIKAFSNSSSSTSVNIVAAIPGHSIMSIGVYGVINYGGNNAFSASGGTQLKLYFGSAASISIGAVAFPATFINAAETDSDYQISNALFDGVMSSFQGQGIYVNQNTSTLITGNAANDNTISLTFYYLAVPL